MKHQLVMTRGFNVIFSVFIILLLFGCNKTNQFDEQRKISEKYYLAILEAFDGQDKVSVYVQLRDESSIVVSGTREERRRLTQQKVVWFEKQMDQLLLTLDSSEVTDVERHRTGFSANVTSAGLRILIENPAVQEIIFDDSTVLPSITAESGTTSQNSER